MRSAARPLLVGLIALSLSMSTNFVSAQACIPIFGQKWTKSYIGVYVASGVSDIQRQQVVLALNIWYSSQQWFIDSYEGGFGSSYLFYLTDRPGDNVITVSFLIGEGLSFAGRALNFVYTTPGNAFVSGDIQINLPPDHASNPTDLEVESIILHELGHGLGLGHSEIQSDAMYAIDNYPQSYGLPSTLDLYAVYMLKQAADPSSLGGSVCLSSQIPYGIPPWVQQNAGNFAIIYPGGRFTGGFSYSYAASPITVRGNGVFQLNLKDGGDYPVRVVSLNAQTDSGQSLAPSESLPQEVDPGKQAQFTFQLQGSDTSSVGTHAMTLHLGFQLLTTEGWSSETDYKTVTGNYEVASQPFAQQESYTTCNTAGWCVAFGGPGTTEVGPALPAVNNGPDMGGMLISLAVLGLVIVFVIAIKHDWKPKKSQTVVVTTGTRTCKYCGAGIRDSDVFCGACGKSQA